MMPVFPYAYWEGRTENKIADRKRHEKYTKEIKIT